MTENSSKKSIEEAPSATIKFSGGTGDSIENAIVISNVSSHQQMIDAEYKHIRQKFGWHMLVEQKLVEANGKRFDIITIRTLPFFKKRRVHFDITEGWKLLEKEVGGR